MEFITVNATQEAQQILLATKTTDVVSLNRSASAPGIGMPFRWQTFLPDSAETRVFQGRLFQGDAPHIWGSYLPEEEPSETVGPCVTRVTYLVVTNLDNAVAAGSIDAKVVEEPKPHKADIAHILQVSLLLLTLVISNLM